MMTARQKFEKHLRFWSTRPFRKGIAQALIQAMDRAWKELT